MEVHIMDLKDVYNKKVKKTFEELEYPLKDSKVIVVVQASEEISSVRAYTQRCSEAAIRTHDILGRLLIFNTCDMPAFCKNMMIICLLFMILH